MKMYVGVDVQIHLFFTTVVDERWVVTATPRRRYPPERANGVVCMTLGGGGDHDLYGRVWRRENVVSRPNWNAEQIVVGEPVWEVRLHSDHEDVCVSVDQIHAFFTSVLHTPAG
jgi:hypothetical protein